jgi:hypothetical protein
LGKIIFCFEFSFSPNIYFRYKSLPSPHYRGFLFCVPCFRCLRFKLRVQSPRIRINRIDNLRRYGECPYGNGDALIWED